MEDEMLKRILLIDDDLSIRRSLSLSLNQLGYDVEPCDSGITALNKLDLYEKNSIKLDSIVVDVNLPDINGVKLGKIIKTKYPNKNMMYITGYADTLELPDIEDLKEEGLLEKPFTADDLVAEIIKLAEKHFKKSKLEIEERIEQRTTSAYVLIKVKNNADLFTLFRHLYFMDNIVYCDATRGDIDIFLLLQSDSSEKCFDFYEAKIKNLEGMKESKYFNISVPVLNDNIRDIIQTAGITLFEDMPGMSKVKDGKKSVYSYVMLDVDREKLDKIYLILKLTENIFYCDYIEGNYNLILMVYGTQFDEITKIIQNKIICLEGINRIKIYPVVNIFEM